MIAYYNEAKLEGNIEELREFMRLVKKNESDN